MDRIIKNLLFLLGFLSLVFIPKNCLAQKARIKALLPQLRQLTKEVAQINPKFPFEPSKPKPDAKKEKELETMRAKMINVIEVMCKLSPHNARKLIQMYLKAYPKPKPLKMIRINSTTSASPKISKTETKKREEKHILNHAAKMILYIFNGCYFKIPKHSVVIIKGLEIPHNVVSFTTEKWGERIWPLKINTNGTIRITSFHKAKVEYKVIHIQMAQHFPSPWLSPTASENDDSYKPVKDFDYLRKKFPLRYSKK